ncbi:MAG: hypothetical protein V1818_01665 [Candidatus Aenigmatarchaeota archaeon]
MEEEKKKASDSGESIWKSLMKEVKEEAPKEESIDETPAAKQGPVFQNSIEKKPIEDSIEKPLENTEEKTDKPKEETKAEEKSAEKKEAPKKSKFTTIMLTKELKEKLTKAKDPHESYGDYIQRLLERA